MSRATLLAAAFLVPLAACALLALVRDEVSNDNAALVLVLLVVAAAATGRRSPGIVAALSATIWFDFFLTRPYETFTINSREDMETALLLVLAGLAVTEIALWGRRQQASASRREGHLAGIVSATGMVADSSAPPTTVISFVERQITDVLGIDRCVFEPRPSGGAHPRVLADGSVVAQERALDVERDGLPTDDVLEIPIRSRGGAEGCFVLTSATAVVRPDREQLQVAVALAEQAASVLPLSAVVRGRGSAPDARTPGATPPAAR